MTKTPGGFKPKKFKDTQDAYDYLCEIYEANVVWLRARFDEFCENPVPGRRSEAFYPRIRIEPSVVKRQDTRLSYGFVAGPGRYSTTVTRPADIFDHYLKEQIRLLLLNHDCPVEIGLSDQPIPIHYALGDDYHLEGDLDNDQIRTLHASFTMPNLSGLDDEVANNTLLIQPGADAPLALFSAPRTDLSIMRLRHYTGTSAKHFQNYVIFTNYQFYIDEFTRICREIMAETADSKLRAERSGYTAFVEPGNKIIVNKNNPDVHEKENWTAQLSRMPQMPAFHLKRADGSGITMVNIGVGPSNAKTITDHIAVLRPHAWLMLGHCAGLRNSQSLGDYALAHGYLREDHILDNDLPLSIPIPALAEIQQALEEAVSKVTGLEGYDLKKVMRTGTVATIDDRNWELQPAIRQNLRLSQSRAIALDMESGTIAGNGFRFRVPYGTLLCVSDKPLHGQPKLPGMADSFYRSRVDQHLKIGLMAMEILRKNGPDRLHSRKLRSFNEVAFQ